MPGYADPLHDLFHSTWKFCISLKEWTCSSILRHCTVLIGIPFGISLSKFVPEEATHFSNSMDTIDILSSSSEDEMEVRCIEKETPFPKEAVASPIDSVGRKLPSWAPPSSSSNSISASKPSQDLSLCTTIPAFNSRNKGRISNERAKAQLGFEYGSQAAPPDEVKRLMYSMPTSDEKASNHHTSSLTLYSNPVSEVDRKSLAQNTPRILPNTLKRPMSTSEYKASTGNGGYVPIHNFHGDTYHPVGANAADRKPYTRDSGLGKDDGVNNYEKRRVLPPTLMHGKAAMDSQPVSMNGAAHRSGVGEERPMDNDERLIFQAALQDLAQPKLEANLPEGILTVSLLRHQKIALAWMLQKETASLHCLGGILADDQGLGKTISMIALIQMQKSLQSKSNSDSKRHEKSEALNLDEDDDNASDLEKIKKTEQPDDLKMKPVASTSVPLFHKGRPAAGTLVVCPASVLRQWARELNDKVTESAKLSVLIYHGSTRTKDPVELAKYDVVLTTYSIVSNEVPKQPLVDDDDEEQRNMEKYAISSDFSTNQKRKKTSNAVNKRKKNRKGNGGSSLDYDSGALARVGWFRVILDEAQTIKNYRTQVARACCGLRAKRRWCLSGTPIQNSIDDLYSYFRFLKYDPYAVYKSFCSTIKYQISRNASTGYKKLQAVLKTVMLRRTKGTVINGEPIIDLPPKSICLKKVDFSLDERAFYSMLEADSRKQFKAYAAAGTVKQNYANILLMLLRLRQACDHPLLVKGYHSASVVKASLDMARKLPREMLINLLNHLEASLAICGVCSDPPEDAVVTMCGHVFCYQCISEHLTGDDNFCPAIGCKDLLGPDVIFSRATLQSSLSDELDNKASSSSEVTMESTVEQNLSTSSKIKAALEILNSLGKSNNPNSEVSSEGCDFCQKRICICVSQFCSSDVLAITDTCSPSNLQTQLPEKAIIFSQWTSMLDLLEISLNHSLIQYRRLDGTMSLASRDRAVKDFTTDPEVTVMIMSLKAGNLGLNMVAASHVILLDLWWNPTTEDQAIDRAHRIGQTRPVTVSRLTIKDTVEDRILALQEEKRKMVSSAFGEDQSGGTFATRLTVEDLRYLFMV